MTTSNPISGQSDSDGKGAALPPLSLSQVFSLALRHHQEQRPVDAESLYRLVLKGDPAHADALHFLGLLCHQQGRTREGERLVRQAITVAQEDADAHSSLGAILRTDGRPAEAEESFQRALSLNPKHVVALCGLGAVWNAMGRRKDAAALLVNAIALRPDYADAHQNLADVLLALGRTAEAFDSYCRSVSLDPSRAGSKKLLAYALHRLGKTTEALQALEDWLATEPNNPVARHLRAAYSGDDVPKRASDLFLREAFDDFASTFNERMNVLSYRGPDLLGEVLSKGIAEPDGQWNVLDAGCGTGLCGPVLRPYARNLLGVDLSPAMIEKANSTGRYDELAAVELTGFLASSPPVFDLIAAADTVIYFGPLEELIQVACSALRSAGFLVFTAESADDDETGKGFLLRHHGRYSHTETYARQVLAEAGFQIRGLVTGDLRQEGGKRVKGFAILAQKTQQ